MSAPGRYLRNPWWTVAAGCAFLLWSSTLFRLDALFSFVEPGGLRYFLPFLAFAAGVASRYFFRETPSAAGRRRWLRGCGIAVLGLFLSLWAAHEIFVYYGESWSRAYVVSWTRAECGCPRNVDDELCLKFLMGYGADMRAGIYECWGQGRVRLVEYSLALLYLLFAATFGALSGLLILPRPPLRIFVSYRRRDGRGLVAILAQALRAELGESNVFVDEHMIAAGEKWQRKIESWVEVCNALVVVVGPSWLEELRAEQGAGETDWVEFEIATAVRGRVPLLPFLFGGASMPGPADLPASLASLPESQAVVLAPDAVALKGGFRVRDERELRRAVGELLVAIEKIRVLSGA